jgi:alanine racemase
VAPGKMRIATFNLGYADGLPRNIGNGKYSFTIHGNQAPIIGNVCMDMVMCDISHIPEAQEGDDAWVFDNQKSCEYLSDAAGTIPYEVLSRISSRVKRVFHYT